ncbi:MAG: DNA-processing protein DprA [Shewanella sp.]|nr:DNA-processing protein DprA [Shewanella sp.]MCF1431249.1 DNA-processing protein DprA [Shewanella sp.]MCF1437868.1 DNA-processing protein DprA [Shewanella sp.]MCF1457322.1 DNA-processing protein DprA [Shewanella sp.]
MTLSELRQRLEFEPESLEGIIPGRINLHPERIDTALAWQDAATDNAIICLDDPAYPPLLRTIYDPPPLLFVKGRPELMLVPAVAVVGSRSASHAGLQSSRMLSHQLAVRGMMICSGLASGIDAAAHLGALDAAGATVAVLGTGVDECYPRRNLQLYRSIREQGCLISEFWPDTKAYAGNFPKRNRIISGISLGTLVVEARLKSGSLITARLAAEQGREVFAVPGGILGGQSKGCHELLKKGAKLVENAVDITEELAALCGSHLEALPLCHHIVQGSAAELPTPSLLSSVRYEVTTLDEVVEHSGKTIDHVLEQILELELQGWVAAVPGGYVRLKRN